MSFSEWIRGKMQEKKLNASDLARALNLKPSAISHWLSDRNLPDPISKDSLPGILDCTLIEVLLITHKTEVKRANEKTI